MTYVNFRIFIIFTMSFFIHGCDYNNFESGNGIDINVFAKKIKTVAGDNAIACGTVEIKQDPLSVDSCIEESFNNQTPFYALYKLQGTDSSGASGLIYNTKDGLIIWSFDSDPSGGGRKDNGKITKYSCIGATLEDKTNNNDYRKYQVRDIFSCKK